MKVAHTAFVVGLLISPLTVSAALIDLFLFDSAENYVSATRHFRLTSTTEVDADTYNRPYSESLDLNRFKGSLYSGPRFLGGWESSGNFQTGSASGIYTGGLGFRLQSADTDPAMNSILVMTRHFVNDGLYVGKDELTLESTITVGDLQHFTTSSRYSGGASASVRAAIQVDGNYYVSVNALALGTSFPAEPYALTISGDWIPFDPLTSIADLSAVAVTLDSAGVVTRAGFHFEHDFGSVAESTEAVWVTSMQIQAIPEPHTLIYMGLALSVMALCRRCR